MKILYPFAKRFIAGHDFDSAKPKIQELMNEGYEVSVDYLGELSTNVDDCEKATEQYIRIIQYYWDKKIDISIKPSQLGLLINPAISYRNLSRIAKLAEKYGHTVRLDMEDSRVTELTRNQAISLNKKYGNVGVAIQANLHRTEQDLKVLIEKKIPVRLVKGAYKESSDVAFQKESDIEDAFFGFAAMLRAEKLKKTAIATHDEEVLEEIEDILPDPDFFDYEFLYGVRRDLQKSLLNKGYSVRIYVPFGKDWLPYTIRRLKEWKNLKFVIKNVFKEWWRCLIRKK